MRTALEILARRRTRRAVAVQVVTYRSPLRRIDDRWEACLAIAEYLYPDGPADLVLETAHEFQGCPCST